MVTENDDEFARLNALVDGELGPAERAAMAARLASDRDLARTYATLARLKVAAGELSDVRQSVALPPPRRRYGTLMAASAGGAMLLGMALLFSNVALPPHRQPAPAADIGPTEITFASLSARTTIPRLESAGLKLMGVALETHGGHSLVVATYRGPHGCRLDLRAWRAGVDMPPLDGTRRRAWQVGDIAYELVVHGMPEWRFVLISEAAETQTRQSGDPRRIERRLREAAVGAPPCLG